MPAISVTHRALESFIWEQVECDLSEATRLATKILTPALINTRTECEILLGIYNLYCRAKATDGRNTTAESVHDNSRSRLNKLRERYLELSARQDPRFNLTKHRDSQIT